jgi:hypothetical protein
MARTRKAEKPTPAVAEATPENSTQEPRQPASESPPPGPQAGGDVVTPITLPWVSGASREGEPEPRQPAAEAAAGKPAYAPDPDPKISVGLSDVKGGPSMHLLRSHRYRQMQVRFDREQPDEKYLAMLRQAGWTDRTESEGVFTKQIDPNARWQSVQKMEREFRDVANAIRQGKGLGPVLEGLGA